MKMILVLKTHAGHKDTPIDVDFGARGEDIVLRIKTGLDSPHTFELVANVTALVEMLERPDLPLFKDDPPARDLLDDILGP